MSRHGFTLIELLVALAVMGLMMVMMTRGLSFVATARERAEDHRQMAQSLAGGLRVVSHELSRALPMVQSRDGQTTILFSGHAAGISFITVTPEFEPGPPFTLWRLQLTTDGRSQILTSSREAGSLNELRISPPSLQPDDQPNEGLGRELLRAQVPLAFRYWREKTEDEPAGWIDTWKDKAKLPRAVMLAALEGPDEAWPPWVVELKVDALFLCSESYSGNRPEELCPTSDTTTSTDGSEDTLDEFEIGAEP